MAIKSKIPLVDHPPSASSSDEDEEQSEQEQFDEEELPPSEAESEEEDEGDKQGNTHLSPILNQNYVQKPQSSSKAVEEESEPESHENQSSSSTLEFTIRPNFKSKPTSASPAPVTSRSPAKRRALDAQEKGSKKKKKIKSGEEDGPADEKKSAALAGTNRLWSEEDQLAILKGMVDYKAQKGADPYADMSAFYDFVKDKLHAEVSKNQVTEKIRRFKKKFLTLSEKGDVPVFAKPHESKVFELSKKIWGTAASNDNAQSDMVEPNAKSPNGKVKRHVQVKKISESKKSSKVSTLMDTPNEESGKKKKKKNGTKNEEIEKKKKKQKIALPGKDKHTAVEEKDDQTAVKENDKQSDEGEHTAAEGNDKHTAPEGRDKHTAAEGNDKQTAPEGRDKHTAAEVKDNQTSAEGEDKQTAAEGKDKQTAAEGKDKHTAAEGRDKHTAAEVKDNQTAAEGKDKQTAAEGKDKQTALGVNDKQISVEGNDKQITANGEVENEKGNFHSKYPHLFNSFNKKNYPLSSQETLDMLKEKVNLIGSSMAEEVEEKWTKLWEEQAELCAKMADLVALQTKLVLDALKR